MTDKILYLSPCGDDSAEGTRIHPMKTPAAAVKKAVSEGVKTVRLLPGEYELRETVILDEAASGLTVEGEGDVILSGGARIPSSRIRPASELAAVDCPILRRFPDVSRIFAADLSEYSLSGTFAQTEGDPRFFLGEGFYENARFPHNDREPGRDGPYAYSTRLSLDREKKQLTIRYDGDEIRKHMSRWDPSVYGEMLIRGYLWQQWDQVKYRPVSGDPETGEVVVSAGCAYESAGESENPHRRTYLTNIPEELENPGEHYYDPDSRMLFFIPHGEISEDPAVSLFDAPAITVKNAAGITLRNLNFRYFRRTPLTVSDCRDVKIESCSFAHLSASAAGIERTTGCVFDSCEVHDTGAGGFWFQTCGERRTLTPSECAVERCTFRDFNRFETCYRPAVGADSSAGLLIRQNTISDCPHNALLFSHFNDFLIENNRFTNLCRDTDDAAAIYWGRDPSDLGTVIRGNDFEKIGNAEATYSVAAIYLDDHTIGPVVEGNLFRDCAALSDEKPSIHSNANALVLNQAQFLYAVNNIFISRYPDEKPCNLYPTQALAIWIAIVRNITDGSPSGTPWHTVLTEAGFFTETWRWHYEHTPWAGMWDLVNEDSAKKTAEYYAAHDDPADPKSHDRSRAALEWEILDELWDHRAEDGTVWPGTLREYTAAAHPKEYAPAPDADPLSLMNDVGNLVFWQAVDYHWDFRNANVFENNLTVGMDRSYLTGDGLLKGNVMNGFPRNFNPDAPETDGWFEPCGTSVTLTEKGLAEVKKRLPTFRNLRLHAGARKAKGERRKANSE